MNLLSQELQKEFEIKISKEVYNSNAYLEIYNFLSNLGLQKIANFFKSQSNEEIEHRNKFMEFAIKRNCSIKMITVEAVDFNISSLQDVADKFLEIEQSTTKFIKSMAFMAFEEEDLITYNFLMEMMKIQENDEEESLTFKDQVDNIGDSVSDWQIYNNTFSL